MGSQLHSDSLPAFDALVAGHVCLDVQPDLQGKDRQPFEDAFLPGHLLSCGPTSFSAGGSVANTGLALKRLGVPTRLCAKVGNDLFARALDQIFMNEIDHTLDRFEVEPASHTSYSVIINYPGVDRIFLHSPGANDHFQAADVPVPWLKQARLFHFGYPPLMRSMYMDGGKELTGLFARAKEAGATTSLDMAFPDPSSPAGKAAWPAILTSVLPWVDVFMPSLEEILFMLHKGLYRELLRSAEGGNLLARVTPELLSRLGQELIHKGAKIVGLKLGERGLYLRTAGLARLKEMGRAQPFDLSLWEEKEFWIPCFQVEVAGTTGAGDATIAGFLAAILQSLPPETALRLAVATGAANVEAPNHLEGIRPVNEMELRVENGWKQHTLDLDAKGWSFTPEAGIWQGDCR